MPDVTSRATLLWSCLQVLNRERFEALLSVFGSLEDAARHLDAEVLRTLGCREKTILRVLELLEKHDAEKEEALLASSGAELLSFSDDRYPSNLREVPDAPMFLYAKGDLSILRQPCIALVGTRKMSPYGARVAQEYTRSFARAGMVTVSGLASGIDSLVAEETMRERGKTVAVLGQGICTLPSRSMDLAGRIIESGGLIVSEFPLRSPADIFTFPLRNRIIAGLSLATVVLEAPESSGALITARLAFDYNREVFAVPGQIFDLNFAGCHALIQKQHAKLSASPADVLREIGAVVTDQEPQPPLYLPKDPDDEKVWVLLSGMPQSVDDLVEKSGLSPGAVNSILTLYELNGVAKNIGGGMWIKS